MALRASVALFVALLVAVHGVPLAAIAPAGHCPEAAEAGDVKEGDHCERKVVRKAPCPHHRGVAGRGEDSRGPDLYAAACSCGHAASLTPSTSDPLMRPRPVAVPVAEPGPGTVAAPRSRIDASDESPPSPPPRHALS